jgi:hypothetical protein
MEALVISVLWFLLGVVVSGVLLLIVFWVISLFALVPAKIEKAIWVGFALVCIILLILRIWPLVHRLIH